MRNCMSDVRLSSSPALAGKIPIDTPLISVKALAEGCVVHVLSKAGTDVATTLSRWAGADRSVRAAAPDQWFIVGDTPLAHAELRALFDQLPPDATGVDLSHGRVRIGISGPMVERVLAKGTGVDLALSVFPVGHSTTTLSGHISVHITRTAQSAFELMVMRGFAESLWDDLIQMSTEFVDVS